MARQFALTTTDNPWNPLTNFDEWYAYDELHGYNTCSYLARIAKTSSVLSDAVNDEILEEAMDSIIRFDLPGLITEGAVHYKKVEQNGEG